MTSPVRRRYGPRDVKSHPPRLYEAYRSSLRRAPEQSPLFLPSTISEASGPGPAVSEMLPDDSDLTRNAETGAEAVGERTIVTGRVLDEHGEPVPNTVIEIWQANAAGRYIHEVDQHDAPLDPNFIGVGLCRTDEHGAYRFLTIRPGAYPWRNHANAWRPPHIHLSVFGPAVTTRLVTQMYFPGEALNEMDPVLNSVPTDDARERLIATYAHDVTEPEWALGYRFDIVLRGPEETPRESGGEHA